MKNTSRSFDDAYLAEYADEHLRYELDMFLWLAQVCGNPAVRLSVPTPEDGIRISNAFVESFAIHTRNLIDFLYADNPKPSDVVAADFCLAGEWCEARPARSEVIETAQLRANKEIAHLTTARIAGNRPEKNWNVPALAEVRAPRHRDHPFRRIVITCSTAS